MPKIPDDKQIYLDYEYLRFKRPDLYRATMQDYDAMVELYSAARAADDPRYASEYSSSGQIRSDIENGLLWYGVEDGEIVIACAVTGEPVFAYDWTLEMRYEDYQRLPGENWFREGERYISVLRFAVRYAHRRNGLISEICTMISQFVYKFGIYEVRTRMLSERVDTCKAIARARFKLVGQAKSPEEKCYYGFFRRNVSKYYQQTQSKRYRPVEDEHDIDEYHEYDFARDVRDAERIESLRRRYDPESFDDEKDGSDEDLMEDI